MSGVDINRGVVIKREATSGVYVYMYIDTPGVYYSRHGREVPENMARLAGFDTDRYARERLRREKLSEAMDAIDAELRLDSQTKRKKVLREEGSYQIIGVGIGKAHIYDTATEGYMTTVPVPEAEAHKVMDYLLGKAELEDEPEGAEAPEQEGDTEDGSASS